MVKAEEGWVWDDHRIAMTCRVLDSQAARVLSHVGCQKLWSQQHVPITRRNTRHMSRVPSMGWAISTCPKLSSAHRLQRWLSKVLASVRLAADQSARLAWHQSLFFEALDSQYTHYCRGFNSVFCYTMAPNTNISTRALVVALKSPFGGKSTT